MIGREKSRPIVVNRDSLNPSPISTRKTAPSVTFFAQETRVRLHITVVARCLTRRNASQSAEQHGEG